MFSVFRNMLEVGEFSMVRMTNNFLIQIGFRTDHGLETKVYSYLNRQKGLLLVLAFLRGEWELAPAGYRIDEKVVSSEISKSGQQYDLVTESRGLDVTIAPNRLLAWCKETGLTQSQLEPILQTLVSEGVLKSFDFFEGQWSEYDDPETSLRLAFMPDFEEKITQLRMQ